MSYDTPRLDGPVRQYESPVLVDVADLSGAWCVCLTSGSLEKNDEWEVEILDF